MKIAMGLLLVVLLGSCGGRREAEPTVVPVPTFTNTPETVPPPIAPAATEPPTATVAPVLLVPTDTPIAVRQAEPVIIELIEEPTATAEPLPTDTPAIVEVVPPAAICDCSGNSLNCKDFGTHAEAQACFDYCMATVGSDVHDIDGNDADGLACESLP